MRISKMISKENINALIFLPFLLTNSLKKCLEISVENLYVDIEV